MIGVPNAVQPDDLAATGQIGSGYEAHQFVDVGVRMLDQMAQGLDDFHQVVRWAVGGHSDSDSRRAVDEQIGEGRWEHRRLDVLAVVVRLEVNGVLVQTIGHGRRSRRHPAFGVAHGGRTVVERSEIAVAVDEGQSHAPRLGQPDQRVVYRRIAVRVVLTHDLTDDTGALDV